jgi:hypothetical protein
MVSGKGRLWSLITCLTTALALASVAGCAGDTSSPGASDVPTGEESTSVSSPGSSPTTSVEGCPYLTVDQVTAALGAPVVETAGSLHACFFDPTSGSGASVMLSRVDVEIEPTAYAAQTRALCQGEVSDVDAGDEAFACVMGLGPQGQLYTGSVLVTVNVNGAADDDAGIAVAAALLPEVTIPPPTG